MYEDGIVLCASSAYTKQFYLNPEFEGLPESIREELKIMCVLFTEDVGAISRSLGSLSSALQMLHNTRRLAVLSAFPISGGFS